MLIMGGAWKAVTGNVVGVERGDGWGRRRLTSCPLVESASGGKGSVGDQSGWCDGVPMDFIRSAMLWHRF